jgi:hypothetical protein
VDQNTFKIGLTITLLAALISAGHLARAQETNVQTETETKSGQTGEVGVIGGSVSRSAFTLAVVNREPRDHLTSLTNDQQHVYYFTELKGMSGQRVTHRWLYNGQTMAEVAFNVGAPRWRVWSSKTLLPSWTGTWSVAVINDLGQEIKRDSFEYVPAETAE